MTLLIKPVINMTLTGLSTNPFYFPSRPDAVTPKRMTVNGIYTQMMNNYARNAVGFRQINRFGSTFFGYSNKPYINANDVRNFWRAVIYQPDDIRIFSKVLFAPDIITGRIGDFNISTPINMPMCHAGAQYNITGFLANYMDAKGDFVLLNTYSGAVTGGGGTNKCNIYSPFNYGYDSGWNGYGAFSPQQIGIKPISNFDTSAQIDEKRVAVLENNYLNIYAVTNQFIDGGACAYNYISQNAVIIESYYIPDLFPGNFTYGYEYSVPLSGGNNDLIFSVSGLTFSTVTTRAFYWKWPGPVLQMINTNPVNLRGSSFDMIIDGGYLMAINAFGNYVSNPAMDYISTSTISLDYSLNVPSKQPSPQLVNITNTLNNVNINRNY